MDELLRIGLPAAIALIGSVAIAWFANQRASGDRSTGDLIQYRRDIQDALETERTTRAGIEDSLRRQINLLYERHDKLQDDFNKCVERFNVLQSQWTVTMNDLRLMKKEQAQSESGED